ncbi:MAG TPA: ABC-three component system protein [Candidatus Limnocylindria bacterium]|nr:ABC-three component system protein [Candidatus Limnocylindria bacterium]
MIHRVYSDLPSFKALSFHGGLNVLLAEKSQGATDRQTRNRAGKTSFVEILHFLLGRDADPKSVFRTKELESFRFGMDFDLAGQKVGVERNGKAPSKITVRAADTSAWPFAPAGARAPILSNTDWRTVLGTLMFGLPAEEQEDTTFPTLRSLLGYFIRRQLANGFTTPEKQMDMQQLGDQQMALMYLLGLDWTIARDWHKVRERERMLRELAKAAGAGAFGAVIGTVAELRTQLTVAEAATRQLRERLQSFRVLAEYESLEDEASKLTKELSELADSNTLDKGLIIDLEESLKAESPPPISDLSSLYAEVGVALPAAALRRFDDVRAFHDSVVQNRKDYLGGEVTAAQRRIAKRDQRKSQLDQRRAEIMGLLQTHGALQQFSQMQGELNRREAEVETLRQRYAAAEQLEGTKTELEIERNRLLLRLRQDFREQKQLLDDAILAFEETSSQLYESAGSLRIVETDNGPVFQFNIQGSRSKGIKNMQIFSFDMMLMRLCTKRGIGPGFLVHDSHLFDGVDGRQVAKALEVGAKTAEELGFQYIVTMNSDDAFKETSANFDLNPYILPTRITDATEDGGLFGIRFG